MKNIKIFEDFSDEDLDGLLNDLEGLGFKNQLTPGKDFGYTSKLKEDMGDTKNSVPNMYITPEGIDFLEKNGELRKDSSGKRYDFFDKTWSCGYNPYGKQGPKYDYSCGIMIMIVKTGVEGKPMGMIYGISGSYGFGLSYITQMSKKQKKQILEQVFEKLKNYKSK